MKARSKKTRPAIGAALAEPRRRRPSRREPGIARRRASSARNLTVGAGGRVIAQRRAPALIATRASARNAPTASAAASAGPPPRPHAPGGCRRSPRRRSAPDRGRLLGRADAETDRGRHRRLPRTAATSSARPAAARRARRSSRRRRPRRRNPGRPRRSAPGARGRRRRDQRHQRETGGRSAAPHVLGLLQRQVGDDHARRRRRPRAAREFRSAPGARTMFA